MWLEKKLSCSWSYMHFSGSPLWKLFSTGADRIIGSYNRSIKQMEMGDLLNSVCMSWVFIVILHRCGWKYHLQNLHILIAGDTNIIYTIQRILLEWNTADNNYLNAQQILVWDFTHFLEFHNVLYNKQKYSKNIERCYLHIFFRVK